MAASPCRSVLTACLAGWCLMMRAACGRSVAVCNLLSLACHSTDLRPWVPLLHWELYLLQICIPPAAHPPPFGGTLLQPNLTCTNTSSRGDAHTSGNHSPNCFLDIKDIKVGLSADVPLASGNGDFTKNKQANSSRKIYEPWGQHINALWTFSFWDFLEQSHIGS